MFLKKLVPRDVADLSLVPPVPVGAWPSDGENMLLSRAVALAGIGAWSCDLADDRLSWSPGVFELFGLPATARLDRRDIVTMYDEECGERMTRLRAAAIGKGTPFMLDARIIRPDGTRRWMRLTADIVREAGRSVKLYGLKQDVTEEKRRWEEMRRLAEHDALTGLASRAVYQNRFLDRSRSAPAIMPLGALILLDVDGFKRVNDRFGHAAGDACLKTLGERLSASFHDALLLARIGGDEFAVLLGSYTSLAAIERRVLGALPHITSPIVWGAHILDVGVSVGIAGAADPFFYDAEAIAAKADAALYVAKSAGRNAVRTAIPNGHFSPRTYIQSCRTFS